MRRAVLVAAAVLAVLSGAAACPSNRTHHGTVPCYDDAGVEIPCDFEQPTAEPS